MKTKIVQPRTWQFHHNKNCEVVCAGDLVRAFFVGFWFFQRYGSQFKPFRTAVPCWGTNYSKFEWFVPNNGTAVLKGLRFKSEILYWFLDGTQILVRQQQVPAQVSHIYYRPPFTRQASADAVYTDWKRGPVHAHSRPALSEERSIISASKRDEAVDVSHWSPGGVVDERDEVPLGSSLKQLLLAAFTDFTRIICQDRVRFPLEKGSTII